MDPIKAAKSKAAKKWAKLDSETVPLYENLSNGKATEADIKKLSELYSKQSKLASDTFNEAVKAAKDSARQSVKKIVKSSVKAKQLLSTPELRKLLETTTIIALQKSADLIRTAVYEALDGTIERVERLIRDVRRMQVKNDEVLVRLRQNSFAGFFSKSSLDTASKNNKASAKAKIATDRQSKRQWLASLVFGKKDENANVIDTPEKLAEAVSNKVISSITVLEKFKAQAQQEFYARALTATDSRSVKARLLQAKSTSEEFLQRAIDYLDNNKRKISDYIFNKDSFAYKSFIRLLNSEADIQSEFTVRTAEQVDKMEKLENAVYGYRELDEDYRDDELEQARREEANFGDKVFTAVAKAFDNYVGGAFFDKAQASFAKSVAEINHDDLEDVQGKLDAFVIDIEDKIAKNNKKIGGDRKQARIYEKAYERYRSIVMRDLKRQWIKEAKDKLAYVRRRIKRQTNRVSKIFKWFTIAYLASVVINSLNSFMPKWKEELWDWMTGQGAEYLKEGGEKVGSLLGKAITTTLGFLWDHKKEIFDFLTGVVKGMMESIVRAGLSLFGIDYDEVFGNTPEGREKKLLEGSNVESAEYRQQTAEAFSKSDAFQAIKKKYNLNSTDEALLLNSNPSSLIGVTSSNGDDLASIGEEVQAEWRKFNLKKKAEEDAAKAAEEKNKPGFFESIKNSVSNGAKAAKDTVTTTATNAANTTKEIVTETVLPAAKEAASAGSTFANNVYNNITNPSAEVIPSPGSNSSVFNNISNVVNSPRISTSAANRNPNMPSVFPSGLSQPLVDQFNTLKGTGSNNSESIGQAVNTNILEPPSINKAKNTAKSAPVAIAQQVNGSVDRIPTFSEDGLAIQNLSLLV